MKSSARSFAVFDIDGTLIRWQLYHAIADELAKHGHISADQYQAIHDARLAWKKRTNDEAFKSYEQQLVIVYEQMLRNLQTADFEQAVDKVFEQYKDQVYRYTRELIKLLKTKNYLLFAISGSQTEIVAKIAEYYGFDDYAGTSYEQIDNRFTGKVTSHLGSKQVVLEELVAKHNATRKDSVAIGDSEGDITLLAAVETPIAFNPSKKLFNYAKEHAWKVVIERKNMLYELEPRDGTYVLV